MRHLFRCTALLAMLVACATDPQTSGSEPQSAFGQALARKQIEQAIFKKILDRVPAYASSRSARALAVCIDWTWVTRDRVSARHAAWTYTSEGSDLQVFAGRLMNNSLKMCEQNKTRAGSRCGCVRVAMGNKSVLRVPDEVMLRLIEQGMPEGLIKCRLPDGIVLDVSARKCEEVGGTPK